MASSSGRLRPGGSESDPGDHLYLWLLTQPERPVPIGELRLVRTSQGVSLRYGETWLRRGFPLSEDLPLIDEEFLPHDPGLAAGAVDDARPDRWGERVIRLIDRPARLSALEYLYFAGDERYGALGVSTSPDNYQPCRRGPLPTLESAERIHELVRQVERNEPIAPEQAHLLSAGLAFGGTVPKALVEIDGEPWVIKFSAVEPSNAPLIEHATMTLALKAEIRVAATLPVALGQGYAVAVRRFDRKGATRVHCLSAAVALRAAGDRFGYPELAQLLRRRGVSQGDLYVGHMRELFRRMVFNILIDNTDDHERSHALTMADSQQYELAAAFDLRPAGRGLGFQQMRVGEHEGDATIANALTMSHLFSLRRDDAIREARAVARVIHGWKEHFRACGVPASDIESYALQIDRPFLADQRKDLKEHRTA